MICARCGKRACLCEDISGLGMDLMDIANEAWMALLTEKIKANIKARNDKRLDDLAEMLVSKADEYWKNKLQFMLTKPSFFEEIGFGAESIMKRNETVIKEEIKQE